MSALPDADPLPEALAALPGSVVTRFVIDDSLTLALRAPGREATLRIDGPGRLVQGDASVAFCADADPAGLAPLLVLLDRRVEDVALGADGCLELRFAGGARLLALPEDHQIAWSVQLAGGASACCIAEGKVVWQ